jgi:3-methyl-2-oxobutanoate hydroxymethyltransferase
MRNAGRFLKEAAADAVKLEGAGPMCDRIAALTRVGIPVMGHLGLTPQTATALGGWKAQGRSADAAVQLLHDALAVQDAGAFALVLECVPSAIATRITERLDTPTIGIGAGPGCDGQVLVFHDMLGLYEGHTPRFVKRYADLRGVALEALREYSDEVRARTFPDQVYEYSIAPEELTAFEERIAVEAPAFDR